MYVLMWYACDVESWFVYIDTFQNSYVSFHDFLSDPVSLLANPNLVVRVDGKYYTWQVAAPLIMSVVVYLQVLPQKTQNKITEKHMPKKASASTPWCHGVHGDAHSLPYRADSPSGISGGVVRRKFRTLWRGQSLKVPHPLVPLKSGIWRNERKQL